MSKYQTIKKFNLNILLVDDDRISREVGAETFKMLGCAVETAEDGEEALKKYQEKEFNLVFMDLTMPEKDGYQVTKELLAAANQKNDSKLQIVALSGSIKDKKMVDNCLEHGMIDCMAKPPTVKILEERMVKWGFQPTHDHTSLYHSEERRRSLENKKKMQKKSN